MDKNHTEGEGPSKVFLFNDQVFVHWRLLQLIWYILEPKFDRTKLALLWNKHLVSSVSFTISETEIETSNPQILRLCKVVLRSDGSVVDSRAGIFKRSD